MVTLKIAQTSDGQAAGGDHDQRLSITGLAANLRTHVLRAMHDAIMVGIGTVLGDDPLMTVRLPGCDRRPARVVLDARLDLPCARASSPLPGSAGAGYLRRGAEPRRRAALLGRASKSILPARRFGRLDLRAALGILAKRGITRVFSEAARASRRPIAQGLADEMICYQPETAGTQGRRGLIPEARASSPIPAPVACWHKVCSGR